MTDMLVKLTDLPPVMECMQVRQGRRIEIRRAMTYERSKITAWIKKTFSLPWADECKAAFSTHPVGCFIAVASGRPVGFCCIDCTFRGFVGPIGVAPQWQGFGIGRALLVAALHTMKAMGYGYGVIGNVAAPAFFEKAVEAVSIDDHKADLYPGQSSENPVRE